MFTSGLALDYGASMLVAKAGDPVQQGDGTDVAPEMNGIGKLAAKPDLASNIVLGKRILSFQVSSQADGRPWQLASWLKNDGNFRSLFSRGTY